MFCSIKDDIWDISYHLKSVAITLLLILLNGCVVNQSIFVANNLTVLFGLQPTQYQFVHLWMFFEHGICLDLTSCASFITHAWPSKVTSQSDKRKMGSHKWVNKRHSIKGRMPCHLLVHQCWAQIWIRKLLIFQTLQVSSAFCHAFSTCSSSLWA